MSGWFLYILTRLDAVNHVVEVVSFIGIFVIIGCTLAYAGFKFGEKDDDTASSITRIGYKMGIVWFFSILLWVFVPTTKEACVIYLLPKVVNNEQVQKVPSQALRMLNMKMEQWIQEQIAPVKGGDE